MVKKESARNIGVYSYSWVNYYLPVNLTYNVEHVIELKILTSTKLKVLFKTNVLTLSLSTKNTKQMIWGNLLLKVEIFCTYSAEYFSQMC